MKESEKWFYAQSLDDLAKASKPRPKLKWKHLFDPWLKCNIGFSWFERNRLGETSWVLRDSSSTVINVKQYYWNLLKPKRLLSYMLCRGSKIS